MRERISHGRADLDTDEDAEQAANHLHPDLATAMSVAEMTPEQRANWMKNAKLLAKYHSPQGVE